MTDDFSGTLSQWTGSYFGISGGVLTCSYPGECILGSNTGSTLGDGSYTADVKITSSGAVSEGLVFRCQTATSCYWISVGTTSVGIIKRSGSTNTTLASGNGVGTGAFYRFRVDLSKSGSTLSIKLYCSGALKATVSDASPLAAGPIGFIGGYNMFILSFLSPVIQALPGFGRGSEIWYTADATSSLSRRDLNEEPARATCEQRDRRLRRRGGDISLRKRNLYQHVLR